MSYFSEINFKPDDKQKSFFSKLEKNADFEKLDIIILQNFIWVNFTTKSKNAP